jgi:hypothetical protein
MQNLATKSGETVDLEEIVKTDIFRMLMSRDRVQEKDFLRLCAETGREIGQYRSSSADGSRAENSSAA